MSTKNKDTSSAYRNSDLAITRRTGNIHSYAVIKGIMGSSLVESLPLRIRCECSLPECQEIIGLSLSQRRGLRTKFPKGFIVILSHAFCPPNTQVYASKGFGVVEKPEFTKAVVDL